MKHRVIVIQPIHAEGMKILHAREDLEIIVPDNPDPSTWSNFLPGTEALCVRLTKIPRSLIEAAPDLKIISRHGVGCDNIDVAAATEHGVVVATVGLANAPSVVEHTLALMLALAKRLFDVDRDVRGGDYMRKLQLEGQDIGGRTVLIIGLGRIGSRLAKALNGLGMKCLGVDPAHRPAEIQAMGCEPVTDFRSALPRADFVTVHTPLQDDTRNMIGARELALMKPSAILINTARGGLVDEVALRDALRAGRIAGAGFDVLTTEPPVDGNPLLESDLLALPNFILTPHVAWASGEAMQALADQLIDNVEAYVAGTPRNLV